MLTKNNALEIEQKLEIQRGRIRRMEYTTMGLLSRIILDADANSRCPEAERTTIGRRVEFMSASFPLAISEDHIDLLLPAGLPKLLPDIPDPRWAGASFRGEKTPWLKQTWPDRASGATVIANREYLIFRPIHTIELRNLGYFKACCWPKLRFMADFNGELPSLMLDPDSGAGYIVGAARFSLATMYRPNRLRTVNTDSASFLLALIFGLRFDFLAFRQSAGSAPHGKGALGATRFQVLCRTPR